MNAPRGPTAEDILFVTGSEIRAKIMRHLIKQTDYITLTDLAQSISVRKGREYFHCKGLRNHGLIDDKNVAGKKYVRITEKGINVIKEINRKKVES